MNEATSTAGWLLDNAARRLREVGSESGRLEAELLLARAAGWDRTFVLAHPEAAVPDDVESAFMVLVARRAASEPIAYLLGEREFYGRMFHVDRRALIPRPETELLVEIGVDAIARLRERGISPRVVDIGTGAGAIAISVALEAQTRVVATDISHPALTLARENAALHSAAVGLAQTDLVNGIRGPLHVLLANLPYVPDARPLPPDVRNYEPAVALFGGRRGTELIERLLREAAPLLAPGGELALELDEDEQAAPVAALARVLYPDALVETLRDNGGYDRVVRILLSEGQRGPRPL